MRLIGVAAALVLAGCAPQAEEGRARDEPEPAASTPAAPPSDPEPAPAPSAPIQLTERREVVMRADPPPPYTYWAPEGSVIRNHPTNPGVWIAYVDGGQAGGYYFGDACGAAARQDWIGRPRAELPSPAPGESRRVFETGDALTEDLRPDRTNIEIDPATQRVASISCH